MLKVLPTRLDLICCSTPNTAQHAMTGMRNKDAHIQPAQAEDGHACVIIGTASATSQDKHELNLHKLHTLDAEKRMVPEPMKRRPSTRPMWPVKMVRKLPDAASHSLTVLSSDPLQANDTGDTRALLGQRFTILQVVMALIVVHACGACA